jgi:uncharacterized protein
LTDRGLTGYYFTLLVERYVSDNTSSESGQRGRGQRDSTEPQRVGARKIVGPQFIDAYECVRRGLAYSGEVPLSRFKRLVADLPAQHGVATWQLKGETGSLGEPLLRLAVQASPVVVCQRCLEPFEWPVDSEVMLHLVGSEAELDADDHVSDDEAERGYEKVLGSGHFDILEQVEDELILSMPYIARHEDCSPKVSTDAGPSEAEPERRNPFAALGQLKGQLKKD